MAGVTAVGIKDARTFAMAFATSVTESTPEGESFVARNGKESLYTLMSTVFPPACQTDLKRHRYRSKIARAEFNKLVEASCGFKLARNRRKQLTSVAGTWLWCG
eukprot:CAMPEP_0113721094 /NCGR_PEP_ID=MMETSP0038_2-20120614/36899_1 /TAXON_ID=2898 /ORGANISM="Cryptomonas paramecium" /LENGTH=103 /DNA_ID=CAMNT_0000649979 /DNA_START=53 /DNA_END=361 /DNA_ORIENTATION=+ /assembly_acc=CAM_ASM_000170